MVSSSSSSSSTCLLLQLLLLQLTLVVEVVNGQGCSNTCPPINYGVEVPALCEGDVATTFADVEKSYSVCYPTTQQQQQSFKLNDFRDDEEGSPSGKVTVFANYYTGCNAGRRESGVFAHVAQRFYNQYGNQTTFIQSVKGGGTCAQWASLYQQDAANLYPESDVRPKQMPLSVNDANYEIRDDLFTTPFGHPSYVIMDGNLKVRHKFIGPCCGYESYYDCTPEIAKSLDAQLSGYINDILAESGSAEVASTEAEVSTEESENENLPATTATTTTDDSSAECQVSDFSDWSPCSVTCGDSGSSGIQFRYRIVTGPIDAQCPSPVETRECSPEVSCTGGTCIPELGESYSIRTVSTGFDSPRDVDFHPTPGLHLGEYSTGRQFFPEVGEEAWVVNGGNHSVSIVASLGTEYQTTISRRDRGYYHYMINGTALAFNKVSNSNRYPDRDSFNYWAICNDNTNDYLGTKEANYFMGPTLYNSYPHGRNTVNRLGEDCKEEEECYFLHSDMLHESPACTGIAHDPETVTAYGNVYWAFDATGNRETGQLVRFDFQQPHGPGSMDHSVASVRRYPEVQLERGLPGVHSGMIVHPTRRELYVSVPGANKIVVVGVDSGAYARTAREEYPIFSNRLPSFEYSIYECVDQNDFAVDIDTPSGLALSADGERLFVAERATGKILVYEVSTGALLVSVSTDFKTIGGLAFSPDTNVVYFVDEETNSLNSIQPEAECQRPITSRLNPSFDVAMAQARETVGVDFSLFRNYDCIADPSIPDSAFFDQVHEDTGYADADPNVQSVSAGMDADAALLANRTDCGFDSELNFDALLLGGYFCHVCLPDQALTCDAGGTCSNVLWNGYVCSNEYFLEGSTNSTGGIIFRTANETVVDPDSLQLEIGVTYRFTVIGNVTVCMSPNTSDDIGNETICASKGPLLLPITYHMLSQDISVSVDGVMAPFQLPIVEPSADNNKFGLSAASFTTATESSADNNKSGLSAGAIAGIVIASVAVVIAAAVGAYFILKHSKAQQAELPSSRKDITPSNVTSEEEGSDPASSP